MKRSLTLADVKAELRASPRKGQEFLIEGLGLLLKFLHDEELNAIFLGHIVVAIEDLLKEVIRDSVKKSVSRSLSR